MRWLAGLFLNCSAYWRNLLSFLGISEVTVVLVVVVVAAVDDPGGVEVE